MATKKAKSAIRMEGLTLAVKDVKRSVAFYGKKLGLKIEIDSAPHFALVRGVKFTEKPHDEEWERSAQARDPDGYTIEFAQGRRGKNAPR